MFAEPQLPHTAPACSHGARCRTEQVRCLRDRRAGAAGSAAGARSAVLCPGSHAASAASALRTARPVGRREPRFEAELGAAAQRRSGAAAQRRSGAAAQRRRLLLRPPALQSRDLAAARDSAARVALPLPATAATHSLPDCARSSPRLAESFCHLLALAMVLPVPASACQCATASAGRAGTVTAAVAARSTAGSRSSAHLQTRRVAVGPPPPCPRRRGADAPWHRLAVHWSPPRSDRVCCCVRSAAARTAVLAGAAAAAARLRLRRLEAERCGPQAVAAPAALLTCFGARLQASRLLLLVLLLHVPPSKQQQLLRPLSA